jgi:hypothetical protein
MSDMGLPAFPGLPGIERDVFACPAHVLCRQFEQEAARFALLPFASAFAPHGISEGQPLCARVIPM